MPAVWDEFTVTEVAGVLGESRGAAEDLLGLAHDLEWARQLRTAGLDGDMDVLRARAYLDLLLDKDSRPGQDGAGRQDGGAGGRIRAARAGARRPGQPGRRPSRPAAPRRSAMPAGFAGRITLTIPLATLLGLADRPGEIPGIGPIDPALARDLANAAAANPKTTWCVTVTDQEGHAIGHGCARPEPKNQRRYREKRHKPGPPDGRDPPREDQGRTGVRLHRYRPARPARRIRHLDTAHRDQGRRPGPDRRTRPDHHQRLRPPVPGHGPRPRGQAPAPSPGPARHLHQPHLPAPRRHLRLRAQHPLRGGRPVVPV